MQFRFNNEPKPADKQDTLASREALSANKFLEWIERKNIDTTTFDNEQALEEALVKNRRLLMPGVEVKDVIDELKQSGRFVPVPQEKEKEAKTIEHIGINTGIEGLKIVEDEAILRQLEENNFFTELEKDSVFDDDALDTTLKQSATLWRGIAIESLEELDESYYYEFSDAHLIKGGKAEVKQDLAEVAELSRIFEKKSKEMEQSNAQKVEKSKKIATIVERAVAYGVSELGWYGDNVSIEPTSQFDDLKRGVDEVLEIRKDDNESSFLGLGIDVTYSGLSSKQYKDKFFKLLAAIRDGKKTKIKYFTNHAGRKMPEFSVPKAVLYFSITDVKDLVYMVKKSDDPKMKEGFKNSPQKFTLMNQMIAQCELLAGFAKEYKNDIFRKYIEIMSSIEELSWDDENIRRMLDMRHGDAVTSRMKALIEEFKHTNKTA